jgi:hypothetical protein
MMIFALLIVSGVAIVLVAPVRADLELDIPAEPPRRWARMRVRWLVFIWRGGKARRARPERSPHPRSRTDSSGRRRWRRVLAVLRTPGFLGRTGRLAVELLRALAPRTAGGLVRFGLEDPVSTGVLFGAAHAAVGLAQTAGWELRLEPEFTGPAFAGQARFVWAVRPGVVLWPVVTFVASPITWRAACAALRAK